MRNTGFPLINPDYCSDYWSVSCPLKTCHAQPGKPCTEADGTPAIGFYGPLETNVHRARATKFRLRSAKS